MDLMFSPDDMLLAAVAVTAVICVCAVYAIFQMRRSYIEQQHKLVRAIAVVEEFPVVQREFILFLQRMEADSKELHKIVLQIQAAVAAVNNCISAAAVGAAERQVAVIDSLRDYMDAQEQRLDTIVTAVSDGFRVLPRPRETVSDQRQELAGESRLRREVLSRDPQLRFSLLKEWISINLLAIRRRASRRWHTANDLITSVPVYLEPEAQILDNCILLIGTRQHSEKLAIPLRELDTSSNYRHWFEAPLQGDRAAQVPAVLTSSNGHFELVAKGTNSSSIAN
jgi:hypothetical protein